MGEKDNPKVFQMPGTVAVRPVEDRSLPSTPTRRRTPFADKMNGGRLAALEIIQSQEYFDSLFLRARTGTLPPQVETMLWHYSYGKPTDKLEVAVTGLGDLTKLSAEELAAKAEEYRSLALQSAVFAKTVIDVPVEPAEDNDTSDSIH